MKPFYLYMLRCCDGSYYIGHTDDLEKRIAEHGEGVCGGYTARRRPVELVFVDEFASRLEVLERERQIKGWSRAKKEALVRSDWEKVRKLSQSYSSPRRRSDNSA